MIRSGHSPRSVPTYNEAVTKLRISPLEWILVQSFILAFMVNPESELFMPRIAPYTLIPSVQKEAQEKEKKEFLVES